MGTPPPQLSAASAGGSVPLASGARLQERTRAAAAHERVGPDASGCAPFPYQRKGAMGYEARSGRRRADGMNRGIGHFC